MTILRAIAIIICLSFAVGIVIDPAAQAAAADSVIANSKQQQADYEKRKRECLGKRITDKTYDERGYCAYGRYYVCNCYRCRLSHGSRRCREERDGTKWQKGTPLDNWSKKSFEPRRPALVPLIR